MTRQKTPSVSALAVLAVLSYNPDEAVFVSTMTHEWPTRPASIAQALNRLVRQGHVVRAERHGIPYYHLAESARALTGAPAPVAAESAPETTAMAPAPLTADEVRALKLTATMERSLRNLVAGPVGYWGNALSSRKVHGKAAEGLVARGLALFDREELCTPQGCVCKGHSMDQTRRSPHYRISELGKRVVAALETPAESAGELADAPAPVAAEPAAGTTAAAPAVTADEVAALKLSTTMARSLVNLVPGPVGYWGYALSARKVHGGAVEGLVRRGLAVNEVSPCTADGWCVCAGVYGDRSRPAYHYRATELGERVAVALVAVAALAA